MSNFTEKMEIALQEIAQENGGRITFEQCQAFYNEHSSVLPSARSVISKVKQLGNIEYIPKQKVTKSGEPITKKSDIVADIATALDANLELIEGLSNSSKSALDNLLGIINVRLSDDDSEPVTE